MVIPSHFTSLIHIRDVLHAPVTADLESAGDILHEAAEHVANALPQRLERRLAIADLCGVPARRRCDRWR